MASIYGERMDRKELLKRIGSMSQMAYIRPFEYREGKFVVPSVEAKPRDDLSEKGIGEYDHITGPVDGYVENVFVHRLSCDAAGTTGAAVINDRLGLGVYVRYDANALPNLVEWKSMRSGDYALGMMPATCFVKGRAYEREYGRLKRIAPFEKLEFNVEIGVLDGIDDIGEFEAFIHGTG